MPGWWNWQTPWTQNPVPQRRAGSNPAPGTIEESPMKITKLKRAVGICRNLECEEYNKDVFLLDHAPNFNCTRCHKLGRYLPETSGVLDSASMNFYQVRVEFNYDPDKDIFRSIAIVTDESLDKSGGNVYTLKTPLIKTEKRALAVAEALLSNLMQPTADLFDGGGISRAKEHVLYFDNPRELFRIELDLLARKLEGSRLRRTNEAK